MQKHIWLAGLVAVAASCGGGQKGDTGGDPIGTSRAGGGDDLDVEGPTKTAAEALDAGVSGPDAAPDEEAALTLILKNTWDEDLAFNMDRGYGGFIAMYSGKPPNAEVVLPFPKHCTTACDVPDEERCPECPEPEHLKDIRKAQKLEKVPPDESVEVPWDGMVHVYEKSGGCECYAREEIPEATYTVRVCGLRLTKSAKERSKLQCPTAEIDLPVEEPETLEFEFGKPEKKRKRRRR